MSRTTSYPNIALGMTPERKQQRNSNYPESPPATHDADNGYRLKTSPFTTRDMSTTTPPHSYAWRERDNETLSPTASPLSRYPGLSPFRATGTPSPFPYADASNPEGNYDSKDDYPQLEWRFQSKLGFIPFTIVSVTAETVGHPVTNLLRADKAKYWSTSCGVNHEIVLKLEQPALVGYVELANRCTSHCTIFVSLTSNSKENYVQVRNDEKMPHYKSITYNAGFLPGRHIKLRLVRGTPVSLYSIKVIGLPTSQALDVLGSTNTEMLLHTPVRTLMLPPQPKLVAEERHMQPAYPLAQIVKSRPRGQTEKWETDETGKLRIEE